MLGELEKLRYEKRTLHYKYVILILVWTGILIFAFGYGKPGSDLVTVFGFSGTLASILLAGAALIYAFYQNHVYGSANEKLASSVKKMEEVTDSMNQARHVMEHVKDLLEHTTEKFSEVSSLTESIKEQKITMDQLLNTFKYQELNKNHTITSVDSDSDKASMVTNAKFDMEKYLSTYIRLKYKEHKLLVYYLLQAHKKGKTVRIAKFTDWVLNNKIASYSDVYLNATNEELKMAVGMLSLGLLSTTVDDLNNSKAIQIEGTTFEANIENFDPVLEEVITKTMKHSDLNKYIDRLMKFMDQVN